MLGGVVSTVHLRPFASDRDGDSHRHPTAQSDTKKKWRQQRGRVDTSLGLPRRTTAIAASNVAACMTSSAAPTCTGYITGRPNGWNQTCVTRQGAHQCMWKWTRPRLGLVTVRHLNVGPPYPFTGTAEAIRIAPWKTTP